jgi:hypothetical protein
MLFSRLQSRFPVSRPTKSVRHGYDQDAARFDSVYDAERKTLKQVTARSVIERWPCLGETRDGGFGRVHFTAECGGRRDAALCVPARGSLGSWSASSRYSSSRVTAGCRVDATTRLRPWNRRGGTSVDSIEPGANLSRPGGLSVGVYFAFETLNQLTSEGGSLFVRKSKRFDQELLSVHTKTLARHGLRSIRPRHMITRVSTRPGDPRETRDEPECTRQRTRRQPGSPERS